MTEEINTPATLRMDDELALRVKKFMEKEEITVRNKALIRIIEKGLDAEFTNSSMTIENKMSGNTIQNLKVLLSLKSMEIDSNEHNITAISKEEIADVMELLNNVDTILRNLNFYSEALLKENFTALHDMAEFAKKIL